MLRLDSFAYKVSHDLKAPLSTMKGLMELSSRENLSEKSHHYLELMQRQATNMYSFISDVLDYSRHAHAELKRIEVNLPELIWQLAESIPFNLEGKTIRFTYALQDTTIVIDENCLKIILNNLVTNAVTHHHLNDGWVTLTETRDSSTLTFRITDNGPGIDLRYQEKIFEMFYRVSRQPGSGLGLYIVKEMVSRLNGEIKLEPQLGEGSAFIVMLPILSVKPS